MPELTGCPGQCEGRHMAGSLLECQQWGHQRNQEHTAHRAHPACYVGSSGRRQILCLQIFSGSFNSKKNTNHKLIWCFVLYRCRSPGDRSQSDHCIHRAHSDPGTSHHRCGYSQEHSPKKTTIHYLGTIR